MARTMMSDAEVQDFKVVASGKKKKGVGSNSTPSENSTPQVKVSTTKSTGIVHSSVSAGEIKEVMYPTVWRVMQEINPDIPDTEQAKLNSDEFGYCILLTMLTGAGMTRQRNGLKIREGSAGEPSWCPEHN